MSRLMYQICFEEYIHSIMVRVLPYKYMHLEVHISRKAPDMNIYYLPINDATFQLFVFWPSDTEMRINEPRFSDSVSLSFKTRLTSVTCFCSDVT